MGVKRIVCDGACDGCYLYENDKDVHKKHCLIMSNNDVTIDIIDDYP